MTEIQDLNQNKIIMCEEDEIPVHRLVQSGNSNTVVRQTKNIKMDLIPVPNELVNIFRVLWNDSYQECPYKYVYITKQSIPQLYDSIPKVEFVSPSKNRRIALMFNSTYATKTVEENSVLPWFSEEKPFFSCAQPYVNVRFVFYSNEDISDQVTLRFTGDTYRAQICQNLRETHNNKILLATGEVVNYN